MTKKPDNATVKAICKKIHQIKLAFDNWYEYVSAVDDKNPKDSYKILVLRDHMDETLKETKITDFEKLDVRGNLLL